MLSPAVDNLVAQLTRLPGIGTRTAQRLAFHILAAPTDEANAIGSAIADVKARVRPCPECGNLTEEALCGVCADPRRDRTVICVVEQPVGEVRRRRLAGHRRVGREHYLLDAVGADAVEQSLDP